MKQNFVYLALGAVIVVGAGGCAGDEERQSSRQEHLGRGIVVGTLGVQHAQGGGARGAGIAQIVAGQVLKLEGGAYVIREVRGRERRVPLDENTTIDRPAHVGDRIEAQLDDRGRAIHIRNIDHEDLE